MTVGSISVSDTTSIQYNVSSSSSSRSSSSSAANNASSSSASLNGVLFNKTADTAEAVHGGNVQYTLSVQNILLKPLENAIITDRFDGSILTVDDAGGGTVISDGVLQWNIPTLQPGQEWQQSYVLKVTGALPQGTVLNNVATISGPGLDDITLQRKVVAVRTDIVNHLPSTGAANDLLFLLASMPLAGVFAGAQKMLRR